MRSVRVIPCLDVDAGRVVKGVNFVDLRDAGDPVELASRYDAEGADEVVFLDITASSDNRRTMVDVVRATADRVFIPLTVGGGVRAVDDGRDRPWWRLPMHQQLAVRTMLVPSAQVPRDEDAVREFLDDAWSRVDTWVEGHADLATLLPRTA